LKTKPSPDHLNSQNVGAKIERHRKMDTLHKIQDMVLEEDEEEEEDIFLQWHHSEHTWLIREARFVLRISTRTRGMPFTRNINIKPSARAHAAVSLYLASEEIY